MRRKIIVAVSMIVGLALLHLVHGYLDRDGRAGHGAAARHAVQASP